jgi:hypothetical protein
MHHHSEDVAMKIRLPIATALLALPLLLVGSPLAAATEGEDPSRDSRWLAWYGCWEAADEVDHDASSLLVCFEPLATEEGVEIRTLVDGEIVAVERVIADGRPVPAQEGGCEGERTATWSADLSRVFVSSDLRCGEGIHRTTSGVMALTSDGREWLEIHAVRAGEQEPVLGVRRFVPASAATIAAHGVEPPVRDRQLAVTTLRSAMSAPLDGEDVIEVVDRAGSDVARALVAELGHPFPLSADAGRDLLRAGVPADVLDVMVAVTYPERFEIEGTSWHATAPAPVRTAEDARGVRPWPAYGRRIHVGYSPFFYDPFFFGSSFYGYGYGFGGGFFPSRVIVVQPTVRDRRARINPITGITSPRDSDRRAVPRRGTQAAPSGANTSRAPGAATRGDRIPRATPTPTRTRVSPQGASSNRTGSERRARPPRTSGSGSGGSGGS